MRTVNLIVFELTCFSFWNTLLTELSKPCTLSYTNMHKKTEQRENKEVSRRMSHSKHRITYYTRKFKTKVTTSNTPGACIIKLSTTVIYGFRNKLDRLSPNTRLGLKGLPGINTLAYYGNLKLRP